MVPRRQCWFPRLPAKGLTQLLKRMDEALPADPVVKLSLRLPLAEGRTLALVHALGHVFHSELEDSHMLLDAEVPGFHGAPLEAAGLRGQRNFLALASVYVS